MVNLYIIRKTVEMYSFKLVYVVFLIYFLRVVVSIIDSLIYLLLFSDFLKNNLIFKQLPLNNYLLGVEIE